MGGVIGPFVFLESGNSIHKILVGNYLSDNYRLTNISCIIINKNSYMDGVTWDKVVEVLAPQISKMLVSVVSLLFIFMINVKTLSPDLHQQKHFSLSRIYHSVGSF